MNQALMNDRQMQVQASDSVAESQWKHSVGCLSRALGKLSIGCALPCIVATVISLWVNGSDLFSGGSGLDDGMLLMIALGRITGVALACMGLVPGSASLVMSRYAGARLPGEFKWGLVGVAVCAAVVAYNWHGLVWLVAYMAR